MDAPAYQQAIEKIQMHGGVIPGSMGDYTVHNKYIVCGEYPIPVQGFSTSPEYWEIIAFI